MRNGRRVDGEPMRCKVARNEGPSALRSLGRRAWQAVVTLHQNRIPFEAIITINDGRSAKYMEDFGRDWAHEYSLNNRMSQHVFEYTHCILRRVHILSRRGKKMAAEKQKVEHTAGFKLATQTTHTR